MFQTLARLHGSFLKWKHLSFTSSTAKENEREGIRTQDFEALAFTIAPWIMKSSAGKAKRFLLKLLLFGLTILCVLVAIGISGHFSVYKTVRRSLEEFEVIKVILILIVY